MASPELIGRMYINSKHVKLTKKDYAIGWLLSGIVAIPFIIATHKGKFQRNRVINWFRTKR